MTTVKRVLVVVAHPDDHILWAGGTISKLSQCIWHVISLCNSHNDEFKSKEENFESSCRELGIKKYKASKLRDYQDRELMELEQPLKMRREILSFADTDKEYDLIFTHSQWPNCEYGFHANHKEVYNSVNSLIDMRLLNTRTILYFCYKAQGNGRPVIADLERADYKVTLTQSEIEKKQKLKQSFLWARGDLESLSLWDNNEPQIEAFNFRSLNGGELPLGFVKLSN